jgi:HD domain
LDENAELLGELDDRRPVPPRRDQTSTTGHPGTRDKGEPMRMIADYSQGVCDTELPASPAIRLLPTAQTFAGPPIAREALMFASACHANQYRECDGEPFILHPIEVGWLLRRDGQPDEVIAAGLLHDVLEKTATSKVELQRRFGSPIAQLVGSVSDDPSIIDDGARKRELRHRVAHSGSEPLAIFAADKISKVRELALLPVSHLDAPQTRAKLAHYKASLEMLHRVPGAGALVDLLDDELNRAVTTAISRVRSAGPPPNSAAPRRGKRRA